MIILTYQNTNSFAFKTQKLAILLVNDKAWHHYALMQNCIWLCYLPEHAHTIGQMGPCLQFPTFYSLSIARFPFCCQKYTYQTWTPSLCISTELQMNATARTWNTVDTCYWNQKVFFVHDHYILFNYLRFSCNVEVLNYCSSPFSLIPFWLVWHVSLLGYAWVMRGFRHVLLHSRHSNKFF